MPGNWAFPEGFRTKLRYPCLVRTAGLEGLPWKSGIRPVSARIPPVSTPFPSDQFVFTFGTGRIRGDFGVHASRSTFSGTLIHPEMRKGQFSGRFHVRISQGESLRAGFSLGISPCSALSPVIPTASVPVSARPIRLGWSRPWIFRPISGGTRKTAQPAQPAQPNFSKPMQNRVLRFREGMGFWISSPSLARKPQPSPSLGLGWVGLMGWDFFGSQSLKIPGFSPFLPPLGWDVGMVGAFPQPRPFPGYAWRGSRLVISGLPLPTPSRRQASFIAPP